MGPLTNRKTGWIYSWRNCGLANEESYGVFFTNLYVKVNIMYSYEDLLAVANDPTFTSQIPRDVIEKALAEYPMLDKSEKKAVA